ncbi:DMT family transporter [Algirhabdus cladophorae]|uniref:DMT family transporter n=1 Tax=Algirhabdus cladophorae TaxID=3377108 RepID=UPI003B84960A
MTQPTPQNPGLLNWLLIIVLGMIWGGAFMSVRLALDGFAPLTVAALRVSIAALCLLIIGQILGQGIGRVSRDAGSLGWRFAVILGTVSIAAPLTLLSWGQQFVPSALAGVAMGAVPLLVLPLVYVFSPEEGIGPRRVFGIVLGFCGLCLLIGPSAFGGTANAFGFWGGAACIIAACGYAIGSVVTRRAPTMPPITLASATLCVASAILVPLALWFDGWPSSWPAKPTQAILFAALFPTALAAVIRVRVVTTAGSLFMSLTSYQVPVWSVIFGVTLMNESLPQNVFLALALILTGIGISQSRSLISMLRRN